MIDIIISQVVPCRSDVYVALFVPRDLVLYTTADGTGAQVVGTDVNTLPPCARTQDSLTTDQAVGTLEGQQFPVSVGNDGQKARLDAMKHSSYCMGIVKFPARQDTTDTYSSGLTPYWNGSTEVLGDTYSTQHHPAPVVTRRLGFNVPITALMATKGITEALESVVNPNWSLDAFIGTLQYRPVDTDSSDETPFRYGHGATGFATQQINNNFSMAGCRLVWFTTGPTDVEQTATTGHDRTVSVTSAADGGQVGSHIIRDPFTGLYEGSFRVTSKIGHQVNFFDPKPGEVEAIMGIGTTDQA